MTTNNCLHIEQIEGDSTGNHSFNICFWQCEDELQDSGIPHRHEFNEIIIFFEGQGTQEVDLVRHPLKGRTAYFLPWGKMHGIIREPGSSGCIIRFAKDFFYLNGFNKNLTDELPFFDHQTKFPNLTLAEERFEWVQQVLRDIYNEYFSPRNEKADMLRAYLHVLLLQLKRDYLLQHEGYSNQNHYSRHEIITRKFMHLLDEEFQKNHSTIDYASKLHISSNYLNESCKKVYNKTPGQLIQERLLFEAKRLLVYSDFSAKEVAFHLGFDDPAYFARFFKKHTGLSPMDFRKDYLNL